MGNRRVYSTVGKILGSPTKIHSPEYLALEAYLDKYNVELGTLSCIHRPSNAMITRKRQLRKTLALGECLLNYMDMRDNPEWYKYWDAPVYGDDYWKIGTGIYDCT